VSAGTERSSPDLSASHAPSPDEAGKGALRPKPRFALAMATACGLGYIPIAPGTFGSLAGLVLVVLPWFAARMARGAAGVLGEIIAGGDRTIDAVLLIQFLIAGATAALGVWSASRAALFWQRKDPQQVVIDEVSGQHLAIVLGLTAPLWRTTAQAVLENPAQLTFHSVLSWKYLVLGFILFRVFDIWKPFPVRQAESLPGGWGIMADDWAAGVYAAMGLWMARAAGL